MKKDEKRTEAKSGGEAAPYSKKVRIFRLYGLLKSRWETQALLGVHAERGGPPSIGFRKN